MSSVDRTAELQLLMLSEVGKTHLKQIWLNATNTPPELRDAAIYSGITFERMIADIIRAEGNSNDQQ